MQNKLILAIDTSCDETSVAVTRGFTILSNIVASQVELHRSYGGVFPTVAKLAHQENLAPALALALKRAQITPDQLDGVAITIGPGLAPALEVGIAAAQAFADKYHKPLIPANHLEGHVVSVFAQPNARKKIGLATNAPTTGQSTNNPLCSFPILAIITSGGNSLFVKVEPLIPGLANTQAVNPSIDRQPHLKLDTPTDQTSWQPALHYTILGQTLDDAAGECLDKVGRMLNLGYPAGPVIEVFAKLGNPTRYPFPLPLTQTKSYDLSFSGIKTYSRNLLTELGSIEKLAKQDVFDFCASLQQAVFRHITYKLEKLLTETNEHYQEIWLSGGVAANIALRQAIRTTVQLYSKRTKTQSIKVLTPYTKKLCGDNAAMIGVGAHHLLNKSSMVLPN